MNLPQLKACDDIYAYSATVIVLPELEKCGNIEASEVFVFDAPKLKKHGEIPKQQRKLKPETMKTFKDFLGEL